MVSRALNLELFFEINKKSFKQTVLSVFLLSKKMKN
jgi:hypothetical protein